jgi:hypothetical protein
MTHLSDKPILLTHIIIFQKYIEIHIQYHDELLLLVIDYYFKNDHLELEGNYSSYLYTLVNSQNTDETLKTILINLFRGITPVFPLSLKEDLIF